MSKCIKCGAELSLSGDCAKCSSQEAAPPPKVPAILDRDLGTGRVPGLAPNAPLWTTNPHSVPGTNNRVAEPERRMTPQSNPRMPGQAAPTPRPPSMQPRNRPLPPPLPPQGKPSGAIRAHRIAPPAPQIPAPTKPPPAIEPTPELPKITSPEPLFTRAEEPHPDAAKTQVADSPVTRKPPFKARPAALWRRCIAWLVDASVIASLSVAYLGLASMIVGIKAPRPQFSGVDALVERLHTWQPILLPGAILAALLAIVYTASFAILWNGRTPGRVVSGIRLVDRTGSAPTPVRATIRGILAVFSFAFFLGGFWLALFDRRGQTLHDKLTSTFVVRPV